jgi:hypothetical protein
MSATHTPTPWKFIRHPEESDWAGNIQGSYGKVDGIENIRTISCQTKYGTPEEIEANGTFIVRACNSHDALVEALEYARNMARPDAGEESPQALPPSSYEWEQLRLKADAALKLAKGE